MVLTDGYVEEQKKEFRVGKRASERAGLLFTTYCGHNPVNFMTQDVHSMDLTDPLIVTVENIAGVRCCCPFQPGFCLNLMNN